MTPLILKIDVDDKGRPKVENLSNAFDKLDQRSRHAGTGINAFSAGLSKSRSLLNGTVGAVFSLRNAFIGLGLGVLARSAVNTASGFDQMKISLDTITKGKGEETFRKLNEWALRMPINTEKAIQGYTKMRAMGLEPTIKDMTILVDTMGALGGSPEIFESVAMSLGKISAKGRASARDILMMTERGVPAIEILKEELNDSSIGFDNIATSAHKSGEIINAIMRGLEKRYGGLSVRIQDSYAGLMETLQSEFKEFVRVVFMEGGVLRMLETLMKRIADKISELRTEGKLKEWAKDVAVAIKNIAIIAVPVFSGILQGVQLIGTAIMGWLMIIDMVKLAILKLEEVFTRYEDRVVGSDIFMYSATAVAGYLGTPWAGKAVFDKIQKMRESRAAEVAQAAGNVGGFYGGEMGAPEMYGGLPSRTEMGRAQLERERIARNQEQQAEIQEHLAGLVSANEQFNASINKFQDSLKGVPDLIESAFSDKPVKNMERTVPMVTEKVEELSQEYIDFINTIEEETNEGLRIIDKEFEDTWEEMNKAMSDEFVDSFARMLTGGVHDFKDFSKQILNIFTGTMAQMFSERFFRPIADAMIGGLTAPLKGLFGGIMGQAGGAGGTLAGMLGPLAIVGGAGFIASELLGQKKPARQDVVLSWEIDEGKFKQVTDYWAGGAVKNTELMGQVEDTMQSMINMYGSLSKFADVDLEKMNITVASLGNVWGDLLRQVQDIPVQFAVQYESLLTDIFGEAYEFGIAQQIQDMEEQMKALTLGFSEEFVASSIMFTAWRKQAVKDLRSDIDELMSTFEEHIGGLYSKFTQFGETFSEIIGNAFSAALGTGGFTQFKVGLSTGIYELFRQQLIEKFLGDFATQAMRSIWALFGVGGFEGLVSGVIAGTAGPQDITAAVEGMVSSIDSLQPVFDAFNTALQSVDQAMGRNTDATVSNTDAVIKQQQIEEFIADLTTGALAPVQSIEAMQSRYQDLMAGGDMNKLLGFVSGTLLPFYAAYGGDYQQAFSGVVSDLRGLSASYGAGMSPEAVGQAVASAIAPVIGTQPIRVVLEVDGTAIATVLVDQLQTNPELVQSVQEAVQ